MQSFVDEVVDTCPNFGENEIVQLSSILAKLEQSKSRYGLLDLLHRCEPTDYDTLHDILQEWTISTAKLVLDEIQNRLKLIGELRMKLKKVGVDEVHELQPLFERGLWMFGAQFEFIEFTSNKGMTNVIKTIFKDEGGKGTRNRPDFVALPDSSVGFYARASYDENHDEDGVEHLVIIDLKTTGLALGSKEKNQVWKYVKELREQGYLKKYARVDGFVLGDKIEAGENEPTTHGDEVKIYKAYVRKHVSTQAGLTELIPLCKTVKEDISRKLQVLGPFPVEIVNAMPTLTKAIANARNGFSESYFGDDSQRWLALFARDLTNSIGRLLLNFM